MRFDEILRTLKQRFRSDLNAAEFIRVADAQPVSSEHVRALEQLYAASTATSQAPL